MNPNVESEVVSRVESKLAAEAPGFDPLILTTLISLLMDLVSGMCEKLTPEEAVERVGRMSRFQQAALESRLLRKARERGVRDARKICPVATRAVKQVAAEATPEERLEFARYLKPLADESFDLF